MNAATGDGTVVIVGAGQAGVETAVALRLADYAGAIVIIGEEPGAPYSRPPLSKAYLAGEEDIADLALRAAEVYQQHDIALRTDTRVAKIEPTERVVVLESGDRLPYDSLVLATGGAARTTDIAELSAAGNVHTLRTVADAAALRQRLEHGARAVIVGGGYIGLEGAAVLRRCGLEVTVVEAAPRILARVTSPVISEFFERIHRDEGVDVIVNTQVAGAHLDNRGDVDALRLSDGRELATDFVLLGIGLNPRTELAEAAGLLVDNGIVVDECMRTSARDVYAVGDVARHPDPQRGGTRRLESVPNASEQARCVAATLAGSHRAYAAIPWFWSDQFDVKLQTAGVPSATDRVVVRSDPEHPRQLTALYLDDDLVVAADVANKPADFAAAKRLIAARVRVDPDQLADVTRPLKEFARGRNTV